MGSKYRGVGTAGRRDCRGREERRERIQRERSGNMFTSSYFALDCLIV